ncbi:MAG TPA: molybdate ABC transporter substrate-binding protein [Xanthobacteraceae bacterium]|nr:molybdate ABC transporter substrate-binding protein [Xanthobacteraceae bacterium]
MPAIRPILFSWFLAAVLFSSARAAELKILSAGVMKDVVLTLRLQYEKESGNKLVVDIAPAGTLARRIEGGEPFDVVVVPRAVLDRLSKAGKIESASRADLAAVGVGVTVKEGAPRLDISSVEAFKRALLAAKSIAHTDPAAGATSGIYLTQLFEKLGIADQLRPKIRLVRGGSSAELVARGKAEIAVQQASEIVNIPGTVYVGPLPKEIQRISVYGAAISASASDKKAAQALIALLSGPAAARLLQPHGLDPVPAKP